MRRLVAALLAVVLVVAALGVAAALLLGDAGSEGSAPQPHVELAPEPGSDEAPEAALDRFYGQRLAWKRCGEDECAGLTVPLDYDRPTDRTLELALLRVPTRGRPDGALVVNPGGPGAPGTAYAAAASQRLGQPLLAHYDVVGFDPRGAGDSAPVDCLSDDRLDDYVAADPSPDDAAETATWIGLVRAFSRGCAADDRQLAAHVSTVEAARDLDVLRSALGQDQLDYLGKSYGTELGATYAELFPERVGRFVLDGALDVTLTQRELNLGQARGFEGALRAYVASCIESTDSCFLGDSVEEGLGRISDFIDQVDARPLPTSLGRDLAVGNAFYGIAAPLYDRNFWTILSAGLRSAFGGDGTTLLQLSDSYMHRNPAGGYVDNSAEAFHAIGCLDDPGAIPADQVAGELAAFREASPTFGDVFAWALTGCQGQAVRSTEEPLDIDGSGAAPIVVIGTTRDPATPYRWAKALADDLESAVLVSRDGDGHTAYHTGNACIDRAVERYYLDGTVPDDGLTC